MITAQELAARMDGTQYAKGIRYSDYLDAKASGLVICFGQSDDLLEFDGAWEGELDAFAGTTVRVDAQGPILNRDNSWTDDEMEAYFVRKRAAKHTVTAASCPRDGITWEITGTMPHETFRILEDDEVFCIGIVFALDALDKEPK